MMQLQMYMVGNGQQLQLGQNAVPYFRMFNPTRQSERFDKDALYIKNIFLYSIMCPQNSYITFQHQTQLVKRNTIGKDYPEPIVDVKLRANM